MSTVEAKPGISAKELQELIDTTPSGTTIRLASGNYTLDDALTIHRSNVSLEGAGSDATTLTFDSRALQNNDRFGIAVSGDTDGLTLGSLSSNLREGEKQFELASGHGLESGDTVRIWQDNDTAFFDEIGDTSWRKQQYAELRTSMAEVASVDGSRITLDRGAHFDFEQGRAQLERIEPVYDVSLRGFSVEYELGTSDSSAFTNAKGELTGYKAVLLDGTSEAHLADIAVENGPSTAFHISRSLDADVEAIRADGAFNKGSGGNGYAYELRESYDGIFSGLEDSGMRHGLLFASWRSSVGNDIEVAFTDRDINFHGGRDHDNQVRVEQAIRSSESDTLSPVLWINEGGESFGAVTDAEDNEIRFDYVEGSRRSDEIRGSDDGVFLHGGLGHDTLIGGDGHDVLQGGPGNDWYDGDDRLHGGKGIDTALYSEDFDTYRIDYEAGLVRIRNDMGQDDTLEGIEFAAFGDGTVLHTASRGTFQAGPIESPSPDDILERNAIPSGLIDTSTDLLVTGGTTHRWNGGYIAEVFVENVSNETLENPELLLDLDDTIDTLWNGSMTHEGDSYRITDDNARELSPGEAWRLAYRAYGDEPVPDAVAGVGDVEAALLGMHSGSGTELLV